MRSELPARAFKTAWFGKAAQKARIGDPALEAAMREVMRGQADDLGGGVFKKRLNDNRHRSIILAKGGRLWVFAFLFAKQDRANIDPDELTAFRKLAQAYGRMTEAELASALSRGDLQELLHDAQDKVQE
jgi:hypothetical protein